MNAKVTVAEQAQANIISIISIIIYLLYYCELNIGPFMAICFYKYVLLHFLTLHTAHKYRSVAVNRIIILRTYLRT